MLAGVHRFILSVADAAACPLPMQLVMQSHTQREPLPISPDMIVSPMLATVSAAQSAPLGVYEGYGPARQFAVPPGRIIDFGVDASGTVFVLTQRADAYQVHRFGPDGAEEQSWEPVPARGHSLVAIAVAPDGDVLLRGERVAWRLDRDGRVLSTWENPPLVTPDIAILDDGRILSRRRDINDIAIVGRDGRLDAAWSEFSRSPGAFPDSSLGDAAICRAIC